MITRRNFLQLFPTLGAAATFWPFGCHWKPKPDAGTTVNDLHSKLNRTQVHRVVTPDSIDSIRTAVQSARQEGRAVSIAGSRNAMGGQQFGADTVLLDMRGVGRVLDFDPQRGVVEVEAGIEWPELVDTLLKLQEGK
ncbi:MAG: FAD-binding protein, partial [Deltaproteobacteria bacterium]|nr:FAD-binding protein [Deltaproteobacteria bacterium]